jgi:hypothetical protein
MKARYKDDAPVSLASARTLGARPNIGIPLKGPANRRVTYISKSVERLANHPESCQVRKGATDWRKLLAIRFLGKAPRRLPLVPKLLLVVFAWQLLEEPVGGILDIAVVFGTGALFGGDEGAAM